MYILKKSPRTLGLDEPIRHESHKAPVTRRDFIAQGFTTGPAIVAGACGAQRCSWDAESARRHVARRSRHCRRGLCNISAGAGKVPFICFDLAGGANLTAPRC